MKGILIATLLVLGVNSFAETTKTLTLTEKQVLVMNMVFGQMSVANVMKKAKEMDAALPSNEPIILVLDSPGGSIDDGLQLIEMLSHLNRPVNTLSLFSASMGFQTVQGLGKRFVTPEGTLMTHKARGGFGGEFPGQLDSRYSYYLKKINRLDEKAAARTNGKHTLKSYRALQENEFWCDGYDCLKQGFVDEVVIPKCDKTMTGERTEVFKFFFMGQSVIVELVYDKCPIIRSMLDVKVTVNGVDPFSKKVNTSSYYDTSGIGLSKEEIDLLDKKIKEIVATRNNRTDVIKGY